METDRQLPLLRTKLYRPPVPADHVHRYQLVTRLEEDSKRPLILVSAPAGYGKSTLVSCWLEGSSRPGAWLSLDENDNNLRQFLSYFVAALQSLFPEGFPDTTLLNQAPNLPPIPLLGTTLVNELDRIEHDFILVLDDIHCIHEKSVHVFLDFLLRHPPKPMQLVVIGRRDPILPIVSLRASGLLTELRMGDLRFTTKEALKFLGVAMGRHIEKFTAEALVNKAEGWVTGLRLAVLAMRGQEIPGGKLLELKGTTPYVMDYLMGEVLDRQPPGIRHYLLRTSILNRFSAPLCHVLCAPDPASGEGGMDGQGFITFARERNLFMVPLDTENRWHRYHHLFQTFLQSHLKRRCSSEEIAALHFRAGEWFELQGLITESIKHVLAAGDAMCAADIIERHRDNAFTTDRWHVVQRWLAMLPVHIKRERPKLLLTEAWIGNLQHQLDRVPMLLDQAEPLLRGQTETPTVSGEFNFFRGYLAYFEGQTEQSLHYLEDSVSQLSHTKSPFLGEAELMLGLARCMGGRKEAAVRRLEVRIRKVDPSEYYLLSRLIAGLAFIHQLWGDLNSLRVEAQHLRSVSHRHRLGLAEAWSYYFSGCAHLQAGEFETASNHFAQAVERRYVLEPRGTLDAMAGLAMSQQFMGLGDEAVDSCRRLQEFARELEERNYLSVAQSCQARLSLLRGELNSALEWGRSFGELPDTAELFSWLESPSITQARVLIAAGSRQDLLDAARSLETIRELCKASRFPCQIIEVAVLQSIALEKLGRTDEASHALEEAANLSRPGGWVRPFVEAGAPMVDLLNRLLKKDVAVAHIETILAALRDEKHVHAKGQTEEGPAASTGKPKSPSASVQSLVEPLTHRELDILELLTKRLQNKEIAEKLSVSPLTVKSHLQSIYQKLSVENRRQAVERASELVILKS